MTNGDKLNLAVVREHLGERLAKGEHAELIEDVLELLEKLGRRTSNLEFELLRLRKSTKGHKSEKLDQRQLELLLSMVDEAEIPPPATNENAEQFDARLEAECEEFGDEDKDESQANEDKKRPARRRPPEHLPIEERVIEPPASELEGEPMKCIGHVEAHTLDWKPGHFIHVVTKRAKYAPLDGDGPVITAPLPPQVIVRGLAEPGLLAHVIVSKYADHLPLNRLVKIFAREGVDVAVSTMVGWIQECSKLLAPLVSLLGEQVLQSQVLQTDDTGIQVLDARDPEGSKRGHIWGYVGDQQLVYFQYTPDWKADATRQFLEGRIGYIQADAYKGYDYIFTRPGSQAIEVACWAHARRYFVEAKDGGDVRAAVPLALIQKLYKIEKQAKRIGLKPEARARLRRKSAKPILLEIFAWIAKHHGTEPPSSPLGRALTYAINQRAALMRYLENGRLPIDNTGAERALRGIAVGRANWLFAGNDGAGERAAIVYSLIRTCEHNGVEPWEYLRDVLPRLAAGWPDERLVELLPHKWSPTSRAA